MIDSAYPDPTITGLHAQIQELRSRIQQLEMEINLLKQDKWVKTPMVPTPWVTEPMIPSPWDSMKCSVCGVDFFGGALYVCMRDNCPSRPQAMLNDAGKNS